MCDELGRPSDHRMRQEREWGTEVELGTATRLYGVNALCVNELSDVVHRTNAVDQAAKPSQTASTWVLVCVGANAEDLGTPSGRHFQRGWLGPDEDVWTSPAPTPSSSDAGGQTRAQTASAERVPPAAGASSAANTPAAAAEQVGMEPMAVEFEAPASDDESNGDSDGDCDGAPNADAAPDCSDLMATLCRLCQGDDSTDVPMQMAPPTSKGTMLTLLVDALDRGMAVELWTFSADSQLLKMLRRLAEDPPAAWTGNVTAHVGVRRAPARWLNAALGNGASATVGQLTVCVDNSEHRKVLIVTQAATGQHGDRNLADLVGQRVSVKRAERERCPGTATSVGADGQAVGVRHDDGSEVEEPARSVRALRTCLACRLENLKASHSTGSGNDEVSFVFGGATGSKLAALANSLRSPAQPPATVTAFYERLSEHCRANSGSQGAGSVRELFRLDPEAQALHTQTRSEAGTVFEGQTFDVALAGSPGSRLTLTTEVGGSYAWLLAALIRGDMRVVVW